MPERRAAGQADRHAGRDLGRHRGGEAADRRDRLLARPQLVEGERDLHQDQLPRPGTPPIVRAEHQLHPGKRARRRARFGLDDGGDPVERVGEIREPARLAVLGPLLDREREHVREAADAAVLPYRADEGLRGDDPVRGLLQILDRQQQQPVAAEEGVALGVEGRSEQIRPAGDARLQPERRAFGPFRSRAVDNRHQVAGVAREGLAQLGVEAVEFEVPREHRRGVGVDPDGACRVDRRGDGAQDCEDRDRPGETVRGPAPMAEEPRRPAGFLIVRFGQGCLGVHGGGGARRGYGHPRARRSSTGA